MNLNEKGNVAPGTCGSSLRPASAWSRGGRIDFTAPHPRGPGAAPRGRFAIGRDRAEPDFVHRCVILDQSLHPKVSDEVTRQGFPVVLRVHEVGATHLLPVAGALNTLGLGLGPRHPVAALGFHATLLPRLGRGPAQLTSRFGGCDYRRPPVEHKIVKA